MKRMILVLVLLLPAGAAVLGFDLPNNFTDQSVIPHGCLAVVPSVFGMPPVEVDHDETVTVSDGVHSAVVRVRAWRIGCHEPGRSAIALNFDRISGSTEVRYPMPILISQDALPRPAGLFHFGRSDYYDPQGLAMTPMSDQGTSAFSEGVTMVVDAHAERITAEKYNSLLVLRLDWPSGAKTSMRIPNYSEYSSVPQMSEAPLHGRYTGQWVVDGLPRQGLVLQIGEVPPERNYLFLIMFTYLDGEPSWVVGNTDFPVGASAVTVEMYTLEGGEYFTAPLGSYTDADVTLQQVGTMTIRPRHCNVVDVDIDFSRSGFGQVTRRFDRLIRIAGYDCDQTR